MLTSIRKQWLATLAMGIFGLTCVACDGETRNEDNWYNYEPPVDHPSRMAYDNDMIRYLNRAEPSQIFTKPSSAPSGNPDTVYEYDPQANGPVCITGEPFRVSVRETDSPNLVIFLQGGGACWDELCLAVGSAPAGVPTSLDILNPKLNENPVRDWNAVYVPYCDGSLFVGDNDITITDHQDQVPDGKLRYHGLHNLSAALTVAYQHFPNPEKIFFAGSSAGGFGTIFGTPLVRYLWPDTPIYVVGDSSVGVAKDGDLAFINMLVKTFNAESLIPADCDDCLKDGNITGFIDYYLPKDDNVKMGLFTSWYDGTISATFLGLEPEVFQAAVERTTTELHERFPEQYKRFIVNNIDHTTLLGNPTGLIGDLTDFNIIMWGMGSGDMLGNLGLGTLKESKGKETRIGDVSIGQWLTDMVNDSDDWVEQIEPADYNNMTK